MSILHNYNVLNRRNQSDSMVGSDPRKVNTEDSVNDEKMVDRNNRRRNQRQSKPTFDTNANFVYENYGLAEMPTHLQKSSTAVDPHTNTNRKQHRIHMDRYTNFNSNTQDNVAVATSMMKHFEDFAQKRITNTSSEQYEAKSSIPNVKNRKMLPDSVKIASAGSNKQDYFEHRQALRQAYKQDYIKE